VRRRRGHGAADATADHAHSDRRDRHGRGLRGALAPREVPLSRTRAEAFDDLVLDAVEEIEDAVADDPALVARLAEVELGVEDVPPAEALADAVDDADLALGRTEAPDRDRPPRLVVYRRPIELRAMDVADRGRLVHEVVVEQLVDLLDVPADRLDPS
jgi:hypothetical protein